MNNSLNRIRMLPRFNSREIFNDTHNKELFPSNSTIYRYNSSSFENILCHDRRSYSISQIKSHPQLTDLLLPRFNSHRQITFYDENQSADVTNKITSHHNDVNQERNYPLKNLNIKSIQQVYDRSSRNCQFMVYNNIEKSDLESAYAIMGDTLESYIHFRKLSHCKALSNFIDYRNKIYKREKIAQFVSLKTNASINEEDTKQTTTKMIHLQKSQITPSIISETVSLNNSIISDVTPKHSPSSIKEEYIQIPSLDLLNESTPKSIQHLKTPKTIKRTIKDSSSPSIKGWL